MPFRSLMTDTVDLVKKDGRRLLGRKASVQSPKLFMNAEDLPVEAGDLIVRRVSNGTQETYEVLNPGFHERFGGIPAHYQMHVKMLGVPEAKAAVQSITYNVSGTNARVNLGSVDASTNVVSVDARAVQLIEDLRATVRAVDLPDDEKRAALEATDELEKQFSSGRPSKTVVSALLRALPTVESIASIAASIASLL